MDIATLIQKLDISGVKVAFLGLFNKAALYDYVIDKAWIAADALLTAHGTQVAAIREKLATINGCAVKYCRYLPAAWIPYAECVNRALLTLWRATDDLKISVEERDRLVLEFKDAYNKFMED